MLHGCCETICFFDICHIQHNIDAQAIISSCIMQEAVVSLWDWDGFPNVPGVQNDDFLGR